MNDYNVRNARYRWIPCWYNVSTDELTAKNKFLGFVLDFVLWFDVNVRMVDDFGIWIDDDVTEKLYPKNNKNEDTV